MIVGAGVFDSPLCFDGRCPCGAYEHKADTSGKYRNSPTDMLEKEKVLFYYVI